MALTPITVTVQFPDAPGAVLAAQLVAPLHRTSAPTGLSTKIIQSVLDENGAGQVDVWATDDLGTYPTGLAWHFWLIVPGRGQWDTLVTIPATTASPCPLELLPPAIDLPTTQGWISYIPLDQKGAPGGVTPLGLDSLVPLQYLPNLGVPVPTLLVGWAAAEAWAWAAVVYDLTYPLQIASAALTWPDGSAGVFTAVTIDPLWQEITAWTATHATSGLTVTYGTLTRNAQGQIIAPPATYSVA